MAITANDKLALIEDIVSDYMDFGGYTDDSKSAAALDEMANCIWKILCASGSTDLMDDMDQ